MIEPMRKRKAWRVFVKGLDNSDIFYAPTSRKACTKAYKSLYDYDVKKCDISAVRAFLSDKLLPFRHEICDKLSDKETEALLHAFGANQGSVDKAGYRDYYYTYRDNEIMNSLMNFGLMKHIDITDDYGEKMIYFVLTDFGKNVALSMVPEYD